jgi:hypothetical protein
LRAGRNIAAAPDRRRPKAVVRNVLSAAGANAKQQIGRRPESKPKIALRNKGLMIAICDVRKQKAT